MKLVEKEVALGKIVNVVSQCLFNGIRFAIRHELAAKRIVITGTENADALKHLIPTFEILLDSRQQKYAELIINYE